MKEPLGNFYKLLCDDLWILFECIFDFCRMSIVSYAIETKAKRRQIKTQSVQKKVPDNYYLTNSWNL